MNWEIISKLVSGKILSGEIPQSLLSGVNTGDLMKPYDKIVALVKKGKTPDKIVKEVGEVACQFAYDAAEEIRLPINWFHLLPEIANEFQIARRGIAAFEKMMDGQPIDVGRLASDLESLKGDTESDSRPMSKITPVTHPFVRTGYAPLDDHIGGLPLSGVTVLGGDTGVGKTSLAITVALNYIRKYHKRVDYFSLEMAGGVLVYRILEMMKVSKRDQECLWINDKILDLDEIEVRIALAAANEDSRLQVIDFGQLLMKGDNAEAAMSTIAINLSRISRRVNTSILLQSQFHRGIEGSPTVHSFRNSGMIENMAALALLLDNPGQTWVGDQSSSALPFVKDHGHVIVAKSRFGYSHGLKCKHTAPGAILIPWNGGCWGTTSRWESLVTTERKRRKK